MSNLSSITRSLSLNAHSLRAFENTNLTEEWFHALQERYCETEMESMLTTIAESLGAEILNISTVPYQPFGASGTLLMGQQEEASSGPMSEQQQQILGHLDASHIAVHSYFDAGEKFAHFRLELEISSCAGDPSLQVQKLIGQIQPDFLQIDYRVRGLSWTQEGDVSKTPSQLPTDIESLTDYQLVSNRLNSDSQYLALLRRNLDPALAEILQSL